MELEKRLQAREKGEDDFFLLDVRNPMEQEICTIPGTDYLIPVKQIRSRFREIENFRPLNLDLIIYCRSGIRSFKALNELEEQGFSGLFNLQGGILAYIKQVDPSLPRY